MSDEGYKGNEFSSRKPNPVDVHVGSRLRLRRMILGMSQERLGEQMGLTFQQIQKYEKGANRVGASRLFQLSCILEVPVQFFYDELRLKGQAPGLKGGNEPQGEALILDFLNSREGLELNRAFTQIRSAKIRRLLVELVRALADNSEGSDGSQDDPVID